MCACKGEKRLHQGHLPHPQQEGTGPRALCPPTPCAGGPAPRPTIRPTPTCGLFAMVCSPSLMAGILEGSEHSDH